MPAMLTSVQHTLQSFGEISRFLRESVVDEQSRQMRESLGALSMHIDEAIRLRRSSNDARAITIRVGELTRCAREHQLLLTELGIAWQALYEFGAYQRALRELSGAISAWQQALARRSAREKACFRQFELLAWRTLGEALLLIDLHERHSDRYSDQQSGRPVALLQQPALWQRVRAWWRRLWR